jgi:large subunit ribosomal protein L28
MVRSVHKLFRLSHSRAIRELPKPYLDFLEKSRAPPERVIDSPPQTKYLDYNQDHETGYVYRVPDQPIHVVRPDNSQKGLWGGLGMVEGFEKPKKLKPRINRVWAPTVEKHTFYSDILDIHLNVEVTDRTLELIDKHQGFDFYILKTPVQDLHSELGRRLQHKMLRALATDSRDYIKEKYKEFIKPLEEIEWHGLKESEAIKKFRLMRVEETIAPPLKVVYARELIARLKPDSD